MLQAKGLLEVQPRKGVRICAITVDDIDEICVVLSELKCLAVKLTAQKKYTADDLLVLKNYIDTLEIAQNSNQNEIWAETKKLFHLQLVDLSANKRISSIILDFNEQLRRVWSIALRMESIPSYSTSAYRDLYKALLAGDADQAVEIMRNRCSLDRKFLESTIKKSGLRRI